MHLLYYHTNCADGFAALCIAHAALRARGIPADEIKPYPINYGWPNQTPPISVLGIDDVQHIYYLDYTPPAEDLAKLIANILAFSPDTQMTIIDHHEKMANLHGLGLTGSGTWKRMISPIGWNSVFSLTESGASLTWKHFHPEAPVPEAVQLIAHRDLGHAFQTTDDPIEAGLNNQALDLHAALFRVLPRTLETWTPFMLGQQPLTGLLHSGRALRHNDLHLITFAAQHCHWLDFTHLTVSPSDLKGCVAFSGPPLRIPAVNGLGPELVSDACQELLRRYPQAPFAASWYIDAKTGRITYSLRSRKPGHPDGHTNVNDVAKACDPDGGGHPCAAGFSTLSPVPLC